MSTNPISDELRQAFWDHIEVTREGAILGLDKGLVAFAEAWNAADSRANQAVVTEKGPAQDEIERVILRRLREGRIEGYTLDMAREIAALSRAEGQEPVEVKPLDWGKTSYGTPEAFSVIGTYRINGAANGGYTVVFGGLRGRALSGPDGRTNFATMDGARAAAQAHFDQAIRSALVKAHAPAVPDGWKLVPVEPTGEWLSRSRHWIDRYAAGIDDEPQLDRIYSELAAASQPLVRGEGE